MEQQLDLLEEKYERRLEILSRLQEEQQHQREEHNDSSMEVEYLQRLNEEKDAKIEEQDEKVFKLISIVIINTNKPATYRSNSLKQKPLC